MSRIRPVVLLIALAVVVATSARADEVYLSIAGSVGNFRTDARIFNPSFTSDIVISASFLPAGNVSNAAVTPKSITVHKREMVVYDDVVASLFAASGLGAIRLAADGDFVATQRIYAATADGTLGQFVPGLEVAQAKQRSVIIQLKSNGGAGTKGTFRTNVGFVNPNATAANVTLSLFDKTNSAAGQAASLKIEPFGVVAPANVAGYFGNPPQDLSDAWLSVSSDLAIFAYGSVVDNGTTDPTFIPAIEDPGVPPVPTPVTKTVTVGPGFTFDPETLTINPGDTVKWVFRSLHTTTADTTSVEKWDSGNKSTGQEFSHTFATAGLFPYFCKLHSVSGGTGMNGRIVVGNVKVDPLPPSNAKAQTQGHCAQAGATEGVPSRTE
jgi:plastocyanin